MNVRDFYFELPQELIAQDPLEDRSSSRLLALDKNTGAMEHRHFRDIVEYLRPGDCLVINDTKVIPARLFGVKEDTQAKIEVLLLKRRDNDTWETLVKPGKKCRPGTVIIFGDGLLKGTVTDVVEEGNRLIRFSYEGIFEEILDRLGQMPLPPYIPHQLKENGRRDCPCDAARRAWDVSAGQGGKCAGSSHALGVLHGGGGGGREDQRRKGVGRARHLRGYNKLPHH